MIFSFVFFYVNRIYKCKISSLHLFIIHQNRVLRKVYNKTTNLIFSGATDCVYIHQRIEISYVNKSVPVVTSLEL